MKPPSVPMIVVICCGCCFLQSTIAFVVLLPNIYIRKCYISINFAIMQFCLSISATMSFIILGLLKFLPQVSDVKLIWLIYVCTAGRGGKNLRLEKKVYLRYEKIVHEILFEGNFYPCHNELWMKN